MKKDLYFSILLLLSLGLFFFGLGYLVKILPQKHPVYITYYYLAPGGSLLVPVSRQISLKEERLSRERLAREVIVDLFTPPKNLTLYSALPTGMWIEKVALDGDTAEAWLHFVRGAVPQGTGPETQMVNGMVLSMTSVPGVKKVRFHFINPDNSPWESQHLALQDPVSPPEEWNRWATEKELRSAGDKPRWLRTYWMTREDRLLVPVDVILPKGKREEDALAHLLVSGPEKDSALEALTSVFPEGVRINGVKRLGPRVDIDFNEKFLELLRTDPQGAQRVLDAVFSSYVDSFMLAKHFYITVEGKNLPRELWPYDPEKPLLKPAVINLMGS